MLHRLIVVGWLAVGLSAAPLNAQVKCGTTYCGSGSKCDSTLQQCIPLCGSVLCEAGFKCDSALKKCVSACKVSETFDAKQQKCVSKCKSGEFYEVATAKCMPTASPREQCGANTYCAAGWKCDTATQTCVLSKTEATAPPARQVVPDRPPASTPPSRALSANVKIDPVYTVAAVDTPLHPGTWSVSGGVTEARCNDPKNVQTQMVAGIYVRHAGLKITALGILCTEVKKVLESASGILPVDLTNAEMEDIRYAYQKFVPTGAEETFKLNPQQAYVGLQVSTCLSATEGMGPPSWPAFVGGIKLYKQPATDISSGGWNPSASPQIGSPISSCEISDSVCGPGEVMTGLDGVSLMGEFLQARTVCQKWQKVGAK